MMEEELPPICESKKENKTADLKINQIKAINIAEQKSEIPPSKSVCPTNNIAGLGDIKQLSNSTKNEDKNGESMDDFSTEGGRLTFYREGKPLLELSHRTEQGSWVQVKSKTYWPPSTTAKTTTQLKNGSSLWSASDDCSNNSSAFNDHVRKNTSPKRLTSQAYSFYWYLAKLHGCIRLKPRRNPFTLLYFNNCNLYTNFKKRPRSTLKAKLRSIRDKLGYNIESSQTIDTLYESWKSLDNNNTVQSPRKRLMKYINGEKDCHSRKKPYSGMPSISHKNSDRAVGSSLQNTNRGMSSYSIESLLNNECSSRNESFLRNLLKSDSKESSHTSRNYSGHEPQRSMKPKNWCEANDGRNVKKAPPEYNSMRKMAPSISNFYLNPYLNPSYMVMPPFYPTTPPTPEMAHMVAAAINLQGIQNSSIMSSASLEASYRTGSLPSPQPRVPSHSSHSPQPRTLNLATPNSPQSRILSRGSGSPQPRTLNHASPNSPQSRASPNSISPSPNPKHLFNSHLANMSSYIGLLNSPPSPWVPSTSSNSPPNLSNSPVSPPPQDVPLNLSKRKEKG